MQSPPPFDSLILAMSIALFSISAAADIPYAKITFPSDGAKLGAQTLNHIDYEVVPGQQGDHIHLYVDNQEAAILRKLSGSHAL